jgi:hypothetical protein
MVFHTRGRHRGCRVRSCLGEDAHRVRGWQRISSVAFKGELLKSVSYERKTFSSIFNFIDIIWLITVTLNSSNGSGIWQNPLLVQLGALFFLRDGNDAKLLLHFIKARE